MLEVVYASTGPENKTEEEKYKPIDICKLPVSMDVGHFVQLKGCNKRKIELKQVACSEMSQANAQFPCYKGSDVIMVRTNFPAVLNASLDKSGVDEDMLKEVNLYWENGVNTTQGCIGWEECRLYLEVSNVVLYKRAPGKVDVGEIMIDVRPLDDTQKEKDVQVTTQKEDRYDRIRSTSEKTLEEVSPEAVSTPRSSISVRSDVAPADFVGTWTGKTTDKLGEGATSDTMILHVQQPSRSDWRVSVLGTFPLNGKQKINKIQLVDNKIGFHMPASDGNTVIWLGLHPTQDNRLIGESFALEPDCDGRNVELTRQKKREVSKHQGDAASRRKWHRRLKFRQ
ncbi:MAG: hypothetical protein JSW00_05050 [Thermoplasmata archaeon]|nr:MAG: hypothetical protein JSW00_05050 [Thermoplasmata archaeon]